jgi:hypothetical protein
MESMYELPSSQKKKFHVDEAYAMAAFNKTKLNRLKAA